MNEIGVYIGRFCPIHKGHQTTLEKMLDNHTHRVVLLGSCNAPWSLKNFFNYYERRSFIKTLYPKLKLTGLPDYPDDDHWVTNLVDTIESIFGEVEIPNAGWSDKGIRLSKPGQKVLFYTGSEEDSVHLIERKFNVVEHNRYTNTNISGQEIRDALLHGRDLSFLDSKIRHDVQTTFIEKWKRMQRV